MGVQLSKIRIKNFRSIESLSLELGKMNLLIGQNNTGKTNFLKAANIAISGAFDLSEDDIFVARDERLERVKTAVIDILLQPTNYYRDICTEFSDFWMSVFTDSWTTTSPEGNFVGIRTEIKYDPVKDSYGLNRRCIRQWGNSIEDATIEVRKTVFNEDIRSCLQSFYMDANRDIVQDLRNKKSYFGRVTASHNLSAEMVNEIETHLNTANAKIIESIPSLKQMEERISVIGQTIGSESNVIEIEPLARKITDLNKGMDIVMRDGKAASFPIEQHGYGTRSWISFLTLSAFVEYQNQKLKEEDDAEQFILLTMEEPEAHLHPQAQRQLFEQILHFGGQKIVSTHSPSVITQASLTNVIYFSKRDGKTTAIRYIPSENQENEDMIFREVINTRSDLLFASAVILCEGITEELALPVYFMEYFGCSPFSLGVSIINIGGKNKYQPFLSLLKNFDIPWNIFSDGEAETVKTVQKAVRAIFNEDYTKLKNVVLLDNGFEYETYLIREGYDNDIIEAICEHEDDAYYFDSYINQKQGQNRKEKIAKKLSKSIIRDYTIPDGRIDALVDLCLDNKTEYALPVAKKIVTRMDVSTRIPSKIASLFNSLSNQISYVSLPTGVIIG